MLGLLVRLALSLGIAAALAYWVNGQIRMSTSRGSRWATYTVIGLLRGTVIFILLLAGLGFGLLLALAPANDLMALALIIALPAAAAFIFRVNTRLIVTAVIIIIAVCSLWFLAFILALSVSCSQGNCL